MLRTVKLALLLCALFWAPSAAASQINPADSLVRAPVVLKSAQPPAPQLAQHYRSSPRIPLGFHGLQYLGGVLLIGSVGAVALGSVLSTVSPHGPAVIAGGSAGSALASLSLLGASSVLKASGHRAPFWAGVTGLALGVGGLAGLAEDMPFALRIASIPMAFGSVAFSTVALVLNGEVARKANTSLAVVPLEQGAMPVVSFAF